MDLNEKVKTGITKIVLKEATYTDPKHSEMNPTAINFIFGRNGVGKTTLVKAIKDNLAPETETFTASDGTTKQMAPIPKSDVVLEEPSVPDDYSVLIYNQQFIDDNFKRKESSAVDGVYIALKKNIDIENAINEKRAEQDTLKKDMGAEITAANEINDAAKKTRSKEEKKIRDKVNGIKDQFQKCDVKMGTINTIFRAVHEKIESEKKDDPNSQKSPAHTLEEIRTQYDTAFSSTAMHYDPLKKPDNVRAYERFLDDPILAKKITSRSDSDYATFIKKLQALDWVRIGHENYEKNADGCCPYCGQPLVDHNRGVDIAKDIADCFDESYQEDLNTLRKFESDFKAEMNRIFLILRGNLDSSFPAVKDSLLRDKLDILKAAIAENVTAIKQKLESPESEVYIDSVEEELKAVLDVIDDLNEKIQKNNEIVDGGKNKADECTKWLKDYIVEQIRDDVIAYDEMVTQFTTQAKIHTDKAEEMKTRFEAISKEIDEKTGETESIEKVCKLINEYLGLSGFKGFKLNPNVDKGNYQVIRDNGEPADHLSEGERNFIAFLYFYFMVYGFLDKKNANKKKIVVIDDPVTSMDSSTLFLVGSLVKKLISGCHGTIVAADRKADDPVIQQMFILTHNVYFHKEVTMDQDDEDRFNHVNFYLIRKSGDNISTIKPCVRKQRGVAGEPLENYNPVQNSYAALWTEYKEVKTGISTMNVIRRILEYYFVQLCGFDKKSLTDILLGEEEDHGHKEDFIIRDTGGKVIDDSKYEAVDSMLKYLDAAPSVLDDGAHYVADMDRPELYREVFEMIFICMGQKQHYDMMMKAIEQNLDPDEEKATA